MMHKIVIDKMSWIRWHAICRYRWIY